MYILMMVVLNVYSQINKQPNGCHRMVCKVLHVRWVWAIHCRKVPLSDQIRAASETCFKHETWVSWRPARLPQSRWAAEVEQYMLAVQPRVRFIIQCMRRPEPALSLAEGMDVSSLSCGELLSRSRFFPLCWHGRTAVYPMSHSASFQSEPGTPQNSQL